MIPIRSILSRTRALLRLGAPPALNLMVARWFWGYLAREFAFQWLAWIAIAAGAIFVLDWPSGALGVAALTVLGALFLLESWLAWEAWRSAAVVRRELEDEVPGEPAASRFPRSHLVFPALMWVAHGVKHQREVVYHREEHRRVRLDVYMPSAARAAGELRPAVVQVHGGGWIFGSRCEQGIPLLNHLAANGWVGFNIDYRLSPRATMPEHVIDVKRAIAWVREHAEEYGVDPSASCLTGGSAGGHLCALAALTSDDRSLPAGLRGGRHLGRAAVPFYGLYDLLDDEERYLPATSATGSWTTIVVQGRPRGRTRRRSAPPPRRTASTRTRRRSWSSTASTTRWCRSRTPARSSSGCEEVSARPVLYVELPGSEHAFDLAPSLRCARVVEGIERFLRTVVEPAPDPDPQREHAHA